MFNSFQGTILISKMTQTLFVEKNKPRKKPMLIDTLKIIQYLFKMNPSFKSKVAKINNHIILGLNRVHLCCGQYSTVFSSKTVQIGM